MFLLLVCQAFWKFWRFIQLLNRLRKVAACEPFHKISFQLTTYQFLYCKSFNPTKLLGLGTIVSQLRAYRTLRGVRKFLRVQNQLVWVTFHQCRQEDYSVWDLDAWFFAHDSELALGAIETWDSLLDRSPEVLLSCRGIFLDLSWRTRKLSKVCSLHGRYLLVQRCWDDEALRVLKFPEWLLREYLHQCFQDGFF